MRTLDGVTIIDDGGTVDRDDDDDDEDDDEVAIPFIGDCDEGGGSCDVVVGVDAAGLLVVVAGIDGNDD
jgi:hypothetical protein